MKTYSKFFVPKGTGESNLSSINSFDAALKDAKVFNCNLVPVSSIIPGGCTKQRGIPSLIPGMVLYCVLARADGTQGEKISAGLAYGIGREYGIVAEISLTGSESDARVAAEARVKEMANIRNLKLLETEIHSASIRKIKDRYGCALAILCLYQ